MNDTPCTSGDPERFFPSKWAEPRDVEAVKAECRRCPKRQQCLTWALEHPEPGIWAGTDEKERAAIRRREGTVTAPRPRSDAHADARTEQVRDMAARGWIVNEIAVALGMTRSAASQALYKARHAKAAS